MGTREAPSYFSINKVVKFHSQSAWSAVQFLIVERVIASSITRLDGKFLELLTNRREINEENGR